MISDVCTDFPNMTLLNFGNVSGIFSFWIDKLADNLFCNSRVIGL